MRNLALEESRVRSNSMVGPRKLLIPRVHCIVALDPKILKNTFEVLGPIIQKFEIVLDKNSLQIGKSL